MRSVFLSNQLHTLPEVYAPETVETLVREAGADREFYDDAAIRSTPDGFRDVECIFSTWGMPTYTEEEIRRFFPSLRAVFYAAGSVQFFARPFLACGVRVFSAWAANGVPVAEYTTALVILANKGFFRTAPAMSRGDLADARSAFSEIGGNYGQRVGIIGAGMIGKMVIRMLKAYRLEVVVCDPFLPDETARELGVSKCGLAELFATCDVITNHLANNAETRGMLNYALFASMKRNAAFLNTGRGAQVVESDLIRVLTERSDLTAILDVTDPEPPAADSPFYRLPNCILTPHIAGSRGLEFHRMSEYMLAEFRRWKDCVACPYEVTLPMLATMA